MAVGGDQAGVPQYAQVLGDRGLGQAEVLAQLGHRVLPALQVRQDGQAGRVGQGPQDGGQGPGADDGVQVVAAVLREEAMNHRHRTMVSSLTDTFKR